MLITKMFENLLGDRVVLEYAHMGGESGVTDEPLLLELVQQHLVEHPQLPVPLPHLGVEAPVVERVQALHLNLEVVRQKLPVYFCHQNPHHHLSDLLHFVILDIEC